jgi:hypothetical protein
MKSTDKAEQSALSNLPPGAQYPKKRHDVSARVIEGEMVVLDRGHGQIHQFNQTASFIWERCDGQRTLHDIARQLVENFAVDFSTALCDVTKVIGELEKLNLLERG